MPQTQYTLDLSLVPSTTYTDLQNILTLINPSIGNMTNYELAAFRQDLAALNSQGTVVISNIVEDSTFSATNPVFDITLTGAGNETLFDRAGYFYASSAVPVGPDTITGVGGDMLISTSAANQAGALLQASIGNETLTGGAGDDTLMAGSGNTMIFGANGKYTIDGSTNRLGSSTIRAGSGNSVIRAGAGSDNIWTMGGSDTVYGGAGRSTVHAGTGHDSVYGGSGVMSFDVTRQTFNTDVIQAGSGHFFINLSGFNQSQVHVAQANNVTTITFGVNTITATGSDVSVKFYNSH